MIPSSFDRSIWRGPLIDRVHFELVHVVRRVARIDCDPNHVTCYDNKSIQSDSPLGIGVIACHSIIRATICCYLPTSSHLRDRSDRLVHEISRSKLIRPFGSRNFALKIDPTF